MSEGGWEGGREGGREGLVGFEKFVKGVTKVRSNPSVGWSFIFEERKKHYLA